MIKTLFESQREKDMQKAVEDAKALLADGKYTADKISELLKILVEAFTETQ